MFKEMFKGSSLADKGLATFVAIMIISVLFMFSVVMVKCLKNNSYSENVVNSIKKEE